MCTIASGSFSPWHLFIVCLCVYSHGMFVEATGQLSGVSSLPPPCEALGSNLLVRLGGKLLNPSPGPMPGFFCGFWEVNSGSDTLEANALLTDLSLSN